MSLAAEFARIFAGYEGAHGHYWVPKDAVADERGKMKGRAKTEFTPVTHDMWERHLAGEYQVGVTPIRKDNTCVFGAIDVDIYDLDLNELVARINSSGLPLILCRTKSGGAHLYLFTKEAVPAKLMRSKLSALANALGFARMEIFPKQDEILSEKDAGSWINIPYFGGEDSLRYALGKRALTPAEFLQYVAARTVAGEADLEKVGANSGVSDDVAELLPGAPPCLQRLSTVGFPEGSRNNGLFSLAIYVSKAFPEEQIGPKIREFNNLLMQPPLDTREVDGIIRSVTNKQYGYKCKDQPICSFCDKPECKTREFGVGGGAQVKDLNLDFGEITKVLTKPVIWLWKIDNEIIEFGTKELMNQRAFQGIILECLNMWPLAVKPASWRKFIQQVVERALTMDVPEDATVIGQLYEHLVKFCTSRIKGKKLDELLLDKPYTDDDRSYFTCSSFISYLIQHRFPSKVNEREIYLMLREKGLAHHNSALKGKTINYWSVPAIQTQDADHSVPRERPKDEM